MVGYLKPNFKNMSTENKKIYKSFYCGLCKSLKKYYGYLGVTSLNYEITTFLILINGLHCGTNKCFHGSCTISPFVPVSYVDYLNDDFSFAANISLLVASYEINDNLIDDGGIKWKIINNIIQKKQTDFIFFKEDYYKKIDDAVSNFNKMEKERDCTFYDLVSCCGNMVECLIAPLIFANASASNFMLLKLANLTGQWIYLIDACDDYMDDRKKFRFNPLFQLVNLTEVKTILHNLEKSIATIIEQLPLENYKDILESIFISGMRDISTEIQAKLFQKLNE